MVNLSFRLHVRLSGGLSLMDQCAVRQSCPSPAQYKAITAQRDLHTCTEINLLCVTLSHFASRVFQ